jgi:hypothetical protein
LGKQVADALFDPNRNQSIDILNNSWGPEYMKRQPLALQALESGVKKGRNGLGIMYLLAGMREICTRMSITIALPVPSIRSL